MRAKEILLLNGYPATYVEGGIEALNKLEDTKPK